MAKEKNKASADYTKKIEKLNSNVKKFMSSSQQEVQEAQIGIKRTSQTCSFSEKVAFSHPRCSLMNKPLKKHT
jgi:hypothetical protein